MRKRTRIKAACTALLSSLLSVILLTACAGKGGQDEMVQNKAVQNETVQDETARSEIEAGERINIELALSDTAALSDADKQSQYLAYLQNYLEKDVLEALPDIESADVTLSAPADTDGILISSDEEIHVDVVLELSDGLSSYSASELADMLAKGIGNSTTDDITITDADGVRLFPKE